MKIEIFDMEVFHEDWVFVSKSPGSNEYTIIHNDNAKLKEHVSQKDLLLGGFNNKWYDDGIIHAITHGADNITVKKLNDFIIEEKKFWWQFPFLQYKRKSFRSFDLRDDLPQNLSLKAIEGNIGENIVETGVDFNIGRKLTEKELEDTIKYCKVDVDNTVRLYEKRSSYIESKKGVARLKGMNEFQAMTMTNAKLTAYFLDAKKQTRGDEYEYPIVEHLDLGRYNHILDYYADPVAYTIKELEAKLKEATNQRTIRSLNRRIDELKESGSIYDTKLETKVAGVPHVFAWGGVHGARRKYTDETNDKEQIALIDVGSYYPSMMIEYGFMSRNIPNAKGFEEVYNRRMEAKQTGDKKTSDALKLVLNTCYGAMKNQYNDLYDPRNANAICVNGQLLLTDLIDKLEEVKGFSLIQSNTDGLIIKYPKKNEKEVHSIIRDWEKRTRMNMEYTNIHKIIQKDVNNYIIQSADVYVIEDGEKVVIQEDNGYITTTGSYVSLYDGGDFRNNSLVILHDALVDYFIYGIPVEETIMNETEVEKFQDIAKTGSTYSGTVHYIRDTPQMVQNVNRVYATSNKDYGTVKKIKDNGREDKIAGIPENCYIDNYNSMKISDIDRSYYIDLAKERVIDFVGKRNASKEIKRIEKPNKKKEQIMTKNIFQKINDIRVDFLKAGAKKTGINRHSEFKYFKLEDISPIVVELNQKHGLTTVINYGETMASMDVINVDNPEEVVTFTSPNTTDAMNMKASTVQQIGAAQTYLRRYFYLTYLDIVEEDEVDRTAGATTADEVAPKQSKAKVATAKKSNRPATPKQREEAKSNIIDKDGEATETQLNSIKNGLKKLREIGDHEEFITKVVMKVRDGISKEEAEKLLIGISKKVKNN